MGVRLFPLFLAAAAGLGVCGSTGGLRTKINPRDGLTYLRIAGGSFPFGCSVGDLECFSWEKTPTAVKVKAFWIGQTEVTQAAYKKVTGENPSLYRGSRRPVDRIGWNEARAFCEAVGMRLPTEREWEYAARGGTSSPRYGRLDDIAWYDGNSKDRTHDVALKLPNPYGLYDTLGNVWEWVQDDYQNENEPGKKILRGDSFYNPAMQVRVSDRLWTTPDTAHRDMGVRCAGD